MVLIPGKLTDEVLKLTDESNPEFVGFPIGPDEEAILDAVSQNWARAVATFLGDLTSPPGAGAAALLAEAPAGLAMRVALEEGSPGLLELVGAFGAAIEAAASAVAAKQGVFALPPLPPIADPVPPAQAFEGAVTAWVGSGTYTGGNWG